MPLPGLIAKYNGTSVRRYRIRIHIGNSVATMINPHMYKITYKTHVTVVGNAGTTTSSNMVMTGTNITGGRNSFSTTNAGIIIDINATRFRITLTVLSQRVYSSLDTEIATTCENGGDSLRFGFSIYQHHSQKVGSETTFTPAVSAPHNDPVACLLHQVQTADV